MPSTHTCLHYHLVFGTKDHDTAIAPSWRAKLHAYLGGVVRALEGTPLVVGGVSDHVHLLVGLKPTHNVADVMRELKAVSSRWVHDEIKALGFGWQEGYGAFSVSKSSVDDVIHYIQNQRDHHRTKSFQEEYLAFNERHDISFDPKYLWD